MTDIIGLNLSVKKFPRGIHMIKTVDGLTDFTLACKKKMKHDDQTLDFTIHSGVNHPMHLYQYLFILKDGSFNMGWT
jgi:hypothetical protein